MMGTLRGVLVAVVSIVLTVSHAQRIAAEESLALGGDDAAIGAVVVTGSTQFDYDQQLAIYQNYLGQHFGRELVENLSDSFRQAYLGHGFLAPAIRVELHPEYADVLVVELEEARVGQFDLQPGYGSLAQKIRATVSGKRFSKPLKQSETESLLQALSNINGAVIDARFSPRQENPAIYDLVIDASQKVQAWMEISNEGGELLGPEIVDVELKLNQVFGAPLALGVFGAKTIDNSLYDQVGGYIEWDVTRALKATLEYSNSDSLDVAVSDASQDIEYDTDNWSFEFRYTNKSVRAHEWEVYGRLKQRDHSSFGDAAREAEQRLNSAVLGGAYNYFGQRSSVWVDMNVEQGVNDFGAKSRDSLLAIGTGNEIALDFLVWKARVVSWLPVRKKLSAKLDVRAQYSNDILPVSQSFVLGGQSYVRAYQPGELVGDRGAAGNIEFRYRFDLGKQFLLIPYSYYGIGTVSSAIAGSSFEQSAASAGLGFRIRGNHIRLYVETDKPLTRPSSHRDDDFRVNAGVEFVL